MARLPDMNVRVVLQNTLELALLDVARAARWLVDATDTVILDDSHAARVKSLVAMSDLRGALLALRETKGSLRDEISERDLLTKVESLIDDAHCLSAAKYDDGEHASYVAVTLHDEDTGHDVTHRSSTLVEALNLLIKGDKS